MSNCDEVLLRTAMTAMAPPSVRVGCRSILADDADLLLEDEHGAVTARSPEARRASGAARHVARTLLAEKGHPTAPIGKVRGGSPVWPAEIKGSLAHDQHMAVAAICFEPGIASIGIDVEPVGPLPSEITSLVVSPTDKAGHVTPRLAGRAVFSAKEAIYKASYPLDGSILDYDDISVDFGKASGQTCTGRTACLHWCLAPHVVVLAVISANG